MQLVRKCKKFVGEKHQQRGRSAGPGLTVVGSLLTIHDIFKDGELTWGDAFLAVNTTAQIVFPVYGVGYGLVDVGVAFFSGKSLTTRVKDSLDKNINGSINVKLVSQYPELPVF